MSEEHISFIGNAADIETCAVAWVRRRRFGSWNEKEQSDLEEWLAASLANRVAYWRMNAGYDRIGMLTALRRPLSEQVPKRRPLRFATGALGIIAALEQAGYQGFYDIQILSEEIWNANYRTVLKQCQSEFDVLCAG